MLSKVHSLICCTVQIRKLSVLLSTGGHRASTMVNCSIIDYDCRIVGYECRDRRLLLSRLRIYRVLNCIARRIWGFGSSEIHKRVSLSI